MFSKTNLVKIKADSGFDSSYDFGDSSDWKGSSSWDGSSDWGSSSGSGGGFFIFPSSLSGMVILIVIVVIILYVRSKNGIISTTPRSSVNLNINEEIPDEEIRKLIPDFNKEAFLKERYDDYVKVQNAWMNFDYDTLRSMLTDELYNQYEMQLDTLKIKNQKNVMSDFEYKSAKVTGINTENDKITITIEMIVTFYDYIEQNGSVVRGNKNYKITQHYKMDFTCSKAVKLDKCPNCGAKLEGNASNKCEYCGSIVIGLSDKWVLSKKESKGQK